MTDIHIRIEGHAGRITLDRPKALNAVTWEQVRKIDAALKDWWDDPAVALLIIDAVGDKAFCAGGDLAEMYRSGTAGDFDYGRRFWRDEYQMNARLFRFPKPVVTFLQGYTMGGGVGVGCHGSHRIVGESSRIAMPEVGVGLVPDVGGSLILGRAPGRLGEYLGATAARMKAADAIYAGFADYFVPEGDWDALKETLTETGDWTAVDRAAGPAPDGELQGQQPEIDRFFSGETLGDICRALALDTTPWAEKTRAALSAPSPLSMACALELVRRVRGLDTIEHALGMEYRFTHRAMEHGDFLEGIRAVIIDKDGAPNWRHDGPNLPVSAVAQMLMPLGDAALHLEELST